jgi:hypothetical protein
VSDFAAWHIDPDRRPGGRRTTRPEFHEPGIDAIEQLLAGAPTAAIKLAPATDVPSHWADGAELEWIGERRECKQLVAWFGNLARHPGQHAATILSDDDSAPVTVVGAPNQTVPRANQIGCYVFEPHATVLAARLVGVLAAKYDLASVSADRGYLTGDQRVRAPALTAFEVMDAVPLDLKRLKAALRERRVGRLEIKKRGIDVDPEAIRRQLSVPGEEQRVLLLTRFRGRGLAIIGRRVS